MLRALVGLVGTGLSACSLVGPDYVEPPAPVAESWVEAKDTRVRTALLDSAQWWEAFDDPVLDGLVAEARKNNLSLQAAALRVLQARSARAVTYGGLFPQQQFLSAGYRHGRASENRGGFGAGGGAGGASGDGGSRSFDSDLWSTSFNVSWEIDIWGQLRRAVEQSDALLLAELADYDDVLVTLLGEVASTYVRIRVAEERLAIARDNVRVQQQSLEIARTRYEAGGTSELDVEQAQTLLAGTQAIIPQFEIELRQNEHALCVLLGTPPRDLSKLLEGGKGIPAAPPNVAAGVPADLLRRRPDVRRAERALAAQSAAIGVAKGELFPQLRLAGSIGLSAEKAGRLFEGDSFEAFGGPSIDWPILNYGRIVNAVRVQDARFEELAAVYAETVLAAQQEVEDFLVAYLRGTEQVSLLERGVASANRAVDLSLIQYREGAADFTTVLSTQQAKLREGDALATRRGAVTLAVIGLYRAMGGGWDVRIGTELVPEATRQRMRERTYWGDTLDTRGLTSAESGEGAGKGAASDEAAARRTRDPWATREQPESQGAQMDREGVKDAAVAVEGHNGDSASEGASTSEGVVEGEGR